MSIHKVPLNSLPERTETFIDFFICSCSFEDRCKSALFAFNPEQIGRVFLFANADVLPYLSRNLSEIKNRYKRKTQVVYISLRNPFLTYKVISKTLSKLLQNCDNLNGMLDITSFTHEAMLMVFDQLFCNQVSFNKFHIVYSSAFKYGKWLSKGLGEIRSVLGYAGDYNPLKKACLIVVVGYEYDRAMRLINETSPNRLVLVYGKPNSNTTEIDEAWLYFEKLVKDCRSIYDSNCLETIEVPCNDPFQVSDLLQIKCNNLLDYNLIIAPMNNKITTLGVGMCTKVDTNIQLMYASALEFNYQDYSIPGDKCYIIDYRTILSHVNSKKSE